MEEIERSLRSATVCNLLVTLMFGAESKNIFLVPATGF